MHSDARLLQDVNRTAESLYSLQYGRVYEESGLQAHGDNVLSLNTFKQKLKTHLSIQATTNIIRRRYNVSVMLAPSYKCQLDLLTYLLPSFLIKGVLSFSA